MNQGLWERNPLIPFLTIENFPVIIIYYLSVFFVLCCGSYISYTKEVKDSVYGLPLFLLVSICYTMLWYFGCRKLAEVKDILLLSLICDILMVLAYYIGPMLIAGRNLNWQIWVSGIVTLAGLAWLKQSSC